jgi:ACR3 family arsenite transporter
LPDKVVLRHLRPCPADALRAPHRIAAPSAPICASNFFELAVAVAIKLVGLNSASALATMAGILVEVWIMLSPAAFATRTRAGFA